MAPPKKDKGKLVSKKATVTQKEKKVSAANKQTNKSALKPTGKK